MKKQLAVTADTSSTAMQSCGSDSGLTQMAGEKEKGEICDFQNGTTAKVKRALTAAIAQHWQ